MSRLSSLFSAAGCLALTLGLASACGGQSFTSHGDEGGASNGGSGQAGTHTTAGTGHGGSSYGGSGAAAGAGGGIGRCDAPPDAGQCDAAFQRWYHDPASNQCVQFVWGGCGGNENNYQSLAECQAACGGTSPTACNVPSDCAIGTISCCGVCDGPNVLASQFVAYNKQFAGQYVCGLGIKTLPAPDPSNPGAGAPIACPPCAAPLPGQGTAKYFVPDCVQGQCVVADLRTSPLTKCATTAECRLRNGTNCCEGCGGADQYVSVRNDGSFEKAMCGGELIGCPACAPLPPGDTIPYCNPSGHCDVLYGSPTAG